MEVPNLNEMIIKSIKEAVRQALELAPLRTMTFQLKHKKNFSQGWQTFYVDKPHQMDLIIQECLMTNLHSQS